MSDTKQELEWMRNSIAFDYRAREDSLKKIRANFVLDDLVWEAIQRQIESHAITFSSTYALCEKYLKEQQQQQRGV